MYIVLLRTMPIAVTGRVSMANGMKNDGMISWGIRMLFLAI